MEAKISVIPKFKSKCSEIENKRKDSPTSLATLSNNLKNKMLLSLIINILRISTFSITML
jgi:hypothetical protein